jgi:hypothetical protein
VCLLGRPGEPYHLVSGQHLLDPATVDEQTRLLAGDHFDVCVRGDHQRTDTHTVCVQRDDLQGAVVRGELNRAAGGQRDTGRPGRSCHRETVALVLADVLPVDEHGQGSNLPVEGVLRRDVLYHHVVDTGRVETLTLCGHHLSAVDRCSAVDSLLQCRFHVLGFDACEKGECPSVDTELWYLVGRESLDPLQERAVTTQCHGERRPLRVVRLLDRLLQPDRRGIESVVGCPRLELVVQPFGVRTEQRKNPLRRR